MLGVHETARLGAVCIRSMRAHVCVYGERIADGHAERPSSEKTGGLV